MIIAYYFLAALVLLFTVLPKIPSAHWVFRVADFGKIQVAYFAMFTIVLGFVFQKQISYFWGIQFLLIAAFIWHAIILIRYTPLYRVQKYQKSEHSSHKCHFISANVYQFNTDYERFIKMIDHCQPDIFLTMESNAAWENALRVLEPEYPYTQKVTLENTYGMHFYSKLEITEAHTHFFVADDIPSIEAHLKTRDGYSFVFFGVHPPPPSPTEEETSKERDGDLLSVSKRVQEIDKPVIVVGDFNNVAWSKSSILFRKTSHLIDPQVGRAFISTFHAKFRLLRFPIDLMFHSDNIFIEDLKTLKPFGSDHLPVYCAFYIDKKNDGQKDQVETATPQEIKEAEEIIEEGIQEEGDRDPIAKE